MKAYMCLVDWQHDFPDSMDGARIFPSLELLLGKRCCVDTCGIIELDITATRVVLDSNHFGKRPLRPFCEKCQHESGFDPDCKCFVVNYETQQPDSQQTES